MGKLALANPYMAWFTLGVSPPPPPPLPPVLIFKSSVGLVKRKYEPETFASGSRRSKASRSAPVASSIFAVLYFNCELFFRLRSMASCRFNCLCGACAQLFEMPILLNSSSSVHRHTVLCFIRQECFKNGFD